MSERRILVVGKRRVPERHEAVLLRALGVRPLRHVESLDLGGRLVGLEIPRVGTELHRIAEVVAGVGGHAFLVRRGREDRDRADRTVEVLHGAAAGGEEGEGEERQGPASHDDHLVDCGIRNGNDCER